ncbi:MAG: thiamine-phosphate kinase [Burkholderiaceae bacterium]
MTEFDLIRQYFDRGPPRHAELGIGDDGALLRDRAGMSRVIVTDMLVGGRHFLADVDPASLGHKALAVNLSDLAAMGARPQAFTLAIALPGVDADWLGAFCRGMFALADASGCELIGGDTTRGPLCLSITAIGEVPQGAALRRDHAQPGDDVWVSGALGGAAAALAALLESPGSLSAAARHRLDWPQPRLALGQALRHLASAAIDVSDGLLADLGHVAERSRIGIELRADLVPLDPALSALDPRQALGHALGGGDDYELAFTAPAENRLAIEALGRSLELALTRIGSAGGGRGVSVVDARGRPLADLARGFDHFG